MWSCWKIGLAGLLTVFAQTAGAQTVQSALPVPAQAQSASLTRAGPVPDATVEARTARQIGLGPAENAFDFTAPGVPGFGPLDPADATRLMRLVGQ